MKFEFILDNLSILTHSVSGIRNLREFILTQAVAGSFSETKPDSWGKSTLGAEVEIIRGITFPSSAKYRDPGNERIVCLRTTNVQYEVNWTDLLYVPESYVMNENQYIKKNDILISMANSRELVGKVSLVTRDDIRCTLGGFIAAIRCSESILPEFLMILLRAPETKEKIIDSSTQTTNIANISLGRLRPLEIFLPTKKEQLNIVQKVTQLLDRCDELESSLNRIQILGEATRKSAIDAISTAQTKDDLWNAWERIQNNWEFIAQGPECIEMLRSLILELEMKDYLTSELDANGKGLNWTTAPIKEVCEYIQRGKSPRYAITGSCKVVSQKCVRWTGFDPEKARYIDDATLSKYSVDRFLKDGDLLWNSTGTGTVGRTANFYSGGSEQKYVADSHVTVLRTSKLDHEFLYYWSRSPDVQSIVLGSTTGSTNQQELNLGTLKELTISFPSLAEQKIKVERIKALFAICDQLESEAIKAAELANKFARSVVSILA
jgi:type I restriction enzyme S subunit